MKELVSGLKHIKAMLKCAYAEKRLYVCLDDLPADYRAAYEAKAHEFYEGDIEILDRAIKILGGRERSGQ